MSGSGIRTPGRAEFLVRLAKVRELSQTDNAEALVQVGALLRDAEDAGVASSVLEWGASTICDDAGELEASLRHVVRAIDLDALAPGPENSLHIILNHCQAVLIHAFPWGPKGVSLYQSMVEFDLASESVHALARRMSLEGSVPTTAMFGTATMGVA